MTTGPVVAPVGSTARDGARIRTGRRLVLALAGVALLAKAWLAWRTLGQDDTYLWWPKFIAEVRRYGPVGVYAVPTEGLPYNHPPLTGYWLLAMTHVQPLAGAHLGFFIRIGSVIADFLCAWVIFEVLRRRRPLWQAVASGILVGASPVLYVISGYHGNHDPEIMFLAILSAYLLIDRKLPVGAGLALAAAVSIKLPVAPVVPVVFAAALALGWPVLRRFGLAFGAVIALLWLPPLIRQGRPFVTNVLLYSGNSFPREWGPVQFAHMLRVPERLVHLYIGPGRMLMLLFCAAIGAHVAYRRPDLTVAAVGLTMGTFLLLSPGYAPQYMVWPVAAVYALSFWPATAYNLAAGAFMVGLYTAWSGGLPWNMTHSVGLTQAQIYQDAAVWAVLGWVVVQGGWTLWRESGPPRWPDWARRGRIGPDSVAGEPSPSGQLTPTS